MILRNTNDEGPFVGCLDKPSRNIDRLHKLHNFHGCERFVTNSGL